MPVVPEQSREIAATEDRAGLVAGKAPPRCGECGYEIGSYRVLPHCPMCREFSWEPAPWRPFTSPRAA
jgi:predicted Zn-ribbon and HTH transcriptional regulator